MANLKPPSPQQGSALAKKALAQPSTASNGTSPTDKQQKLAQTLLDKLWLKMTEMYGTRWTASVGDCPDQDHAWSTVLGGLNGREIANGLNVLVERGLEWPPSAPEFRRMCLHIPGLPSALEAWAQALKKVAIGVKCVIKEKRAVGVKWVVGRKFGCLYKMGRWAKMDRMTKNGRWGKMGRWG